MVGGGGYFGLHYYFVAKCFKLFDFIFIFFQINGRNINRFKQINDNTKILNIHLCMYTNDDVEYDGT